MKHACRFLLCIPLFGTLALGCDSPPDTGGSPSTGGGGVHTRGTLHGEVKARSTGAPIRNAVITLGTRSCTSDAAGAFVLEDVATGTVTLKIEATGYLTATPTIEVRGGAQQVGPFLLDGAACPANKACGDRVCGPDPVCGESCGDCTQGSCNLDGLCVTQCEPVCGNRECGADPVCRLSCGDCSTDSCNEEGRCEAVCHANCDGRNCGPDPVCGVSCGECGNGTCGANGVCVATCHAETDAELCQANSRECGSLTVHDRCNQERTITSCGGPCASGTCTSAGRCLLECIPGCPQGFTCNGEATCAGGNLTQLPLNVTTVAVDGRVTMNHALPAESCADGHRMAKILFDELTAGYHVVIQARCAGTDAVTFAGSVFPGTYKVSVLRDDPDPSNSTLPRGSAYMVLPSLQIQSPQSGLVLDVKPPVAVSGTLTMNNALPAQSCADGHRMARILFDELDLGYHVAIVARCAGTDAVTFTGTVFPGTYRVSVIRDDPDPSNSTLPQGATYVAVLSLQVQSAQRNLALDVKTVEVGGVLTMNNALPAQSCADGHRMARILFDELNLGYHVAVVARCAGTDAVTFSGTVFPGTYQVSVIREDPDPSNSTLPQGATYVAVPSLQIQSAQRNLALDVKTVEVGGGLTMNNALPAQSCVDGHRMARILFDDPARAYHVAIVARCAGTDAVTFAGTVFPGTYRVSVIRDDPDPSNSTLPSGATYVAVPSLQIQSSQRNLALDVKTVKVGGVTTMNNALPAQSCADGHRMARILFDELDLGYHVAIVARCAGTDAVTFSGTVFPGTYRVSVIRDDPDPSNSTLPRGAAFVAVPSLQVQSAQTNLALDVATREVGGTLTMNNALPAQSCVDGHRMARISFEEAALGYRIDITARCTGMDSVTFAGTVFPGTYRVSILRDDPDPSNSTLPSGAVFVAITRLLVP